MATPITIWLYGDIGGEVQSRPIVERLATLPDAPVQVRINSGGGSVFEASAIFSALREHRGPVRVEIDGLAASAASYIAMAGDAVAIAENGLLMIHDPFVGGGGNARDLRHSAELLDRIALSMQRAYRSRSGLSAERIASIMAGETWFTADEALAAGFADEITAALDVAAMVDPATYRAAPRHVQQRLSAMKNLRAGETLAALLTRLVSEAATDDRDEAAIRDEMASAARLEESKLSKILAGDVMCPTLSSLEAFARVLGVQLTDLTAAGERDGCDYSAANTGPAAARRAGCDVAAFKADESRRRQEIKAAFTPWRSHWAVSALEDQCLDNLNITTTAARDALLTKLGEGAESLGGAMYSSNRAQPEVFAMNGSTAAMSSRDDGFAAAARDAILLRYGLGMKNPHPAARDLLGASMRDLAATCLSRAGRSPGLGGADATIRAALTTSDFPALLENTANKSLILGLEAEGAATHRDTWTRRGSLPDFKEGSRVALSEAPDLEIVHEAGEITHGPLTDSGKERIALKTYARIVSITRQALVNDDLDQLTRVPQAMGMAAARKEADLVYGLLAANPTMRDGAALFDATHGNLASAGGAITVSTLGEARAAMRKQRGVQNLSYMNIVPTFLVVGADRELEALQVLAEIEPNQTSAVVPGWVRRLTLVVDPRIDDLASGAWYLAGNPAAHDTFEVAFLDGQTAPTIEQEEGFDTLTLKWRVVFDLGVAALDWRALFQNPGA